MRKPDVQAEIRVEPCRMKAFEARWTEVAPGVFRLGVAHVNCYLVVTAEGITLVDAGVPRAMRVLDSLLAHLGARRSDIDALLFTHGHFDHVGMARQLQRDSVQRMLVHPRDQRLVRHPYRYARESTPFVYPFRHPKSLPTLTAMTWNGALGVRGVQASPELHHGHAVDVPGRPVALWTPGHTAGHCGFAFDDLGVLITGDALVTLDPYTGETGPRIIASAATADSAQALESIEGFRASDAPTLLPGHGEPWNRGLDAALLHAHRVGRS